MARWTPGSGRPDPWRPALPRDGADPDARVSRFARLGDLPRWLLIMTEPDWPCGCLIYQGKRDGDGYGRDGSGRLVHREAWSLIVAPIPDDMTLDHVRDRGCRSSACWAPWHLEVVTTAENLRRAGRASQPGPRGRADVSAERIRRLHEEEHMSFAQVGELVGMSKTGVRMRYYALTGRERPDRAKTITPATAGERSE